MRYLAALLLLLPLPAWAAIALGDEDEFEGTGGVTVTTTGADRLILLFYHEEQASDAQQLSAVSVDGKAFTYINHVTETDSSGAHDELWCIQESTLGATTGDHAVSITGGIAGSLTEVFVFTGTAADCSALTGNAYSENNQTSAISNNLTLSLDIPENGGVALSMMAHSGTTNAWSWDQGATKVMDTLISGNAMNGSAAYEILTGAAETGTVYTGTYADGTRRMAGIGVAFAEAPSDANPPAYSSNACAQVSADTISCESVATDTTPPIDHYSAVYADGFSGGAGTGGVPTCTEIQAGTGAVASTTDSDLDIGSGSIATLTSGPNLSASTAYDVYVCAEDDVGNEITDGTKIDATTTASGPNTITLEFCDHVDLYYRAGNCPPELTSPVGGANVSDTTSDITSTSDHSTGTWYWCVAQAATRTSAEIKAGTGCTSFGSTASPTAGVNAGSATGLNPSTTYYGHMVHEENQQDSNVAATAIFSTLSGGAGLAGFFVCDGGANGFTVEADGSDTNDGLSMAQAWQSLSKVNDNVTALGSDVYLCEGGVWEDQTLTVDWSGNAVDTATVGCYQDIAGVATLCDTYPQFGLSTYGNPQIAYSLADTEFGGNPDRQVSHTIVFPEDKTLVSVRPFLIFVPGQPGGDAYYHKGDGGTFRLEIQTDDGSANHFPSGTVIAQTGNLIGMPEEYAGSGPGDAIVGGDPGDDTNFRNFALNTPVAVERGKIYHLVFINTTNDPTAHFVSADNFQSTQSNRINNVPTKDVYGEAVLYRDGAGSWIRRIHQWPIGEYIFSDGSAVGNGYMEVGSVSGPDRVSRYVSSAQDVRQIFTPPATYYYETVSVGAMHVSGTNSMDVEIWDNTDTVIATATLTGFASGTPSGSATGSVTPGTADFQTGTLSPPIQLVSGQQYSLVLSSSNTFTVTATRDGTLSYDYNVDSTVNGHAQYRATPAGTWIGWPVRNVTAVDDQFDISFYFQ